MKTLLLLFVLPMACLACWSCPKIIGRKEWNARPPKYGQFQCMAVRASTVFIHHTSIPPICYNTKTCKDNMNSMQSYHQNTRKWSDIGYNFCIGGDGNIYEGRGWGVVGYPAKGYEFNSTGICFIGDYTNSLPTERMLQAAINIIECGIRKGYINNNPRIRGIGEVVATQSPGKELQYYISETRLGYSQH